MQDSITANHKLILEWVQNEIYEGRRHLQTQQNTSSQKDPLETTKEVFVTFLAGTAILIGLVVLTYSLALIFDKWCCCCPGYQNGQNHAATTHRNETTSLAVKAGLDSLTPEERRQVLEAIFEKITYEDVLKVTSEETVRQNGVAEDSECSLEEGLAEKASSDNVENPHPEGTPESKNSTRQETQIHDAIIQPFEDSLVTVERTEMDETSSQNVAGSDADHPAAEDIDVEDPHSGDKVGLDDADHERVCCICLSEYEQGCHILRARCQHMFHYDCCLEWLVKHDNCPYCRKEMMTPKQFRQAALKILGQEHVAEVGMWGRSRIDLRNQRRRQPAEDPHAALTPHSSENVISQLGDVGWH